MLTYLLTRFLAQHHGATRTSWYPGTIASAPDAEGKYDVQFDDGDYEAAVPRKYMRLPTVAARGAAGARPNTESREPTALGAGPRVSRTARSLDKHTGLVADLTTWREQSTPPWTGGDEGSDSDGDLDRCASAAKRRRRNAVDTEHEWVGQRVCTQDHLRATVTGWWPPLDDGDFVTRPALWQIAYDSGGEAELCESEMAVALARALTEDERSPGWRSERPLASAAVEARGRRKRAPVNRLVDTLGGGDETKTPRFCFAGKNDWLTLEHRM